MVVVIAAATTTNGDAKPMKKYGNEIFNFCHCFTTVDSSRPFC